MIHEKLGSRKNQQTPPSYPDPHHFFYRLHRLSPHRYNAPTKFHHGPLFSETPPSSPPPAPNTNIVPVDKENIENAAAVTGGILGLVLTGPVGAVFLAALTNYVVKKENDSGEALRWRTLLFSFPTNECQQHITVYTTVISSQYNTHYVSHTHRGLGKAVVEAYNFLSKINAKYELSTKASKKIGDAVDNIESESETVESVKSTLATAAVKVSDLNKEYDFVSKAKQVASSASVLSDAAVGKIDEANAKYNFFELAKKYASKAVEKVKDAANE